MEETLSIFKVGEIVQSNQKSGYGLKASKIISESMPRNTKRAYVSDAVYLAAWSKASNECWPMNEETVLKFIIHHLEEMPSHIDSALVKAGQKRKVGTHSLATVKRRLVSLSLLHKTNGLETPCKGELVTKLLTAFQKKNPGQKKSKAITKQVLENMIETCGNSLIDMRDQALILFGWASGGRRRSEIASAEVKNLEETVDGDFIYHLGKSKTDQRGAGLDVPIRGKAAHALRTWLKSSSICKGLLFRSVGKGGKIGDSISDVDINRIVKRRCKMAGYDPLQYSAHGLRRGFITEAGRTGCSLGDTMALSGHKSVPIAMKYFEAGNVLNNPAGNLVS